MTTTNEVYTTHQDLIKAIQSTITERKVFIIIAPQRVGKTTLFPIEILNTIPPGETLWVITSTRSETRYAAESAADQYPSGVGTYFRPRIASDVEVMGDTPQHLNYASVEFALKTNLFETAKHIYLDISLEMDAHTTTAMALVRKLWAEGAYDTCGIALTAPFPDMTCLPEGKILEYKVVEKDPPQPNFTLLPGEPIELCARRLLQVEGIDAIMLYESSALEAQAVYKKLVEMLCSGLLSEDVVVKYVGKHLTMPEKVSLGIAPFLGNRKVIIVSFAGCLRYPSISWIDAVITTGQILSPTMVDFYFESLVYRPLTHTELEIQKQSIRLHAPYGKLLINYSEEVDPAQFLGKLSVENAVSIVNDAAAHNLPMNELKTGGGPRIDKKLTRGLTALETFGLVRVEEDFSLTHTFNGMAVYGEINMTIRALSALALAIDYKSASLAFPYIALLSKLRRVRYGFRYVPMDHIWCPSSDPINAVTTLLNQALQPELYGENPIAQSALNIIKKTYRAIEPKGFGITLDFKPWLGTPDNPPEVVSNPKVLALLKAIVLRAQCDQTYAFSKNRIELSMEDKVALSSKSVVKDTTDVKVVCAALSIINPPEPEIMPFVVGTNVTSFTQAEFLECSAGFPKPLITNFPNLSLA